MQVEIMEENATGKARECMFDARHVASACYAVLSPGGGGGYPIQSWMGHPPIPGLDGGYPIPGHDRGGTQGTPCWLDGVPPICWVGHPPMWT